MRRLFFLILLAIGTVGSVTNGLHLLHHFYLWPLVRLLGYGSLLAYSLLMLGGTRYNTRSFTEEEK